MPKFRIEFELDIIDNSPVITRTQIINLQPGEKIEPLETTVVLRDSNTRYGYIRFRNSSGFGEYIRDSRDIQIKYKKDIQTYRCHREVSGRIDGLIKFFRYHPELQPGDKLHATLHYDTKPILLELQYLPDEQSDAATGE